MKILKYNLIAHDEQGEEIKGSEVTIKTHDAVFDSNYAMAQKEAWNGEVEVIDDGQPEPTENPSQLDIIEAQVVYTAMMTDTLLEG